MSRYIDADKAIEVWKDQDYIKVSSQEVNARIMLDAVPSADVVKVIRCKDCKYRKKVLNCSYGECIYSASMVTDNDFCSNGEVKTNEQEKWDV